MNIIRKARGSEISHRAQRVFLCCDPQNAGKKDELIADLISMDVGMDCVVSYLETGDNVDMELLRNELQEHQALVLWVTTQMLESMSNGNVPVEYSLAKDKDLHIPILPIVEYGELFPRFTQIVGAMHGIARSDAEYRVKLKAQLESFLASDKTIKAIQAKAFTANVFLSYRKIDIREARNFMKKFHDLEGFEAVSIWYDNFLTAGRNFNYEIEESIDESDAFVLLVTPNLATQGNYVQTTEYPLAVEKNKIVLPVEVVTTDPSRFKELYPDTARAVSINNHIALSATFREKLGESAYLERMDSERAYLLGMAYLKGFSVERDFDRAIRLLELASKDSDLFASSAAAQLAVIYREGMGTDIDYNKALHWKIRVVILCEHIFGHEHRNTAAVYDNLGLMCMRQGEYERALEYHQKSLDFFEKKADRDTATTYSNIGQVYDLLGNYKLALEFLQKALHIAERECGTEDPFIAMTYDNMGGVYKELGDYGRALECHQKALGFFEKKFGAESLDSAVAYSNIGDVYLQLRNYKESLKYHQKSLYIHEKLLSKYHPDIAGIYKDMGNVYGKQREDYKLALEYYQKALHINEKVLPKEHVSTAVIYSGMAIVYEGQGDYDRALEYHQIALAIKKKVLPEEHPSIAMSYYNMADVYGMQDDYKQALEYYQKALPIFVKKLGKEHQHTQTTLAIMEAFEAIVVYDRVIEECTRAITLDQNNSDAYKKRAEIYFRKGDFDKTISDSDQIIRLNPNDATAYYNRGVAYLDGKKNYNQAIADFDQAIKFNPNIASSYAKRGIAYASKGDIDRATPDFDQAVKLDPQMLKQILLEARRVRKRRDEEESEKNTDFDSDESIISLNNEPKTLIYSGYDENTMDLFNNGSSDQAVAWDKMGDQLESVGREKEALEYYQKALGVREQVHEQSSTTETLEELSSSYENMGYILTKLGQIEEAKIYYQKALNANETLYEQNSIVDSLQLLLYSHDKMGDNKHALGLCDEAYTHRLKALDLFEQLVKLDPSSQKNDSYFRGKLNQ